MMGKIRIACGAATRIGYARRNVLDRLDRPMRALPIVSLGLGLAPAGCRRDEPSSRAYPRPSGAASAPDASRPVDLLRFTVASLAVATHAQAHEREGITREGAAQLLACEIIVGEDMDAGVKIG